MYLFGVLVGCFVICMEFKRSLEIVVNGENSINKQLSICMIILYVMIVWIFFISKVKVN